MIPPTLPPKHGKGRSSFDGKPYLKALVWFLPAIVTFGFSTIILSHKIDSVWEASGLIPSKPVLLWMKAYASMGMGATLTAIGCLILLLYIAEAILKGHTKLRKRGCHLLAYLTNIAALLMIACAAIPMTLAAETAQQKISNYRTVAALTGSLEATESLSQKFRNTLFRSEEVEVSSVRELDSMLRYDLLEATMALIEHGDNVTIQGQALGQALILLEAESEHDREVTEKRLLKATQAMRDAPFQSIEELSDWFNVLQQTSDWEQRPVTIAR